MYFKVGGIKKVIIVISEVEIYSLRIVVSTPGLNITGRQVN